MHSRPHPSPDTPAAAVGVQHHWPGHMGKGFVRCCRSIPGWLLLRNSHLAVAARSTVAGAAGSCYCCSRAVRCRSRGALPSLCRRKVVDRPYGDGERLHSWKNVSSEKRDGTTSARSRYPATRCNSSRMRYPDIACCGVDDTYLHRTKSRKKPTTTTARTTQRTQSFQRLLQ